MVQRTVHSWRRNSEVIPPTHHHHNVSSCLHLVSIVAGPPSLALLNSYRPHKNNFAMLKQTTLTGSHEHVDKLLPPSWVIVVLPFLIFFFWDEELPGGMMGWMDGKDDHPRILYNLKHYKWYNFNFVAFYGILMNM